MASHRSAAPALVDSSRFRWTPVPLHVLIIGGGIGGLCLAQGLRKAGISVAVYERDRAPDARLQGYRLNIEPIGSQALHACLPAQLWNLLVATAGDPGPRMGVFDERLRELMQEDEDGASDDPATAHHAVSRITLRRLLLSGLGDVVRFNKQFLRYEQSGPNTVTAYFSDGSAATGQLLVGADGVGSRVRRQLLPEARGIDTPAVGVGGKLPITSRTLAWLPQQLTMTKNMVLPPRDFLFTAAFRRRDASTDPDTMRQTLNRLCAMGLEPDELLHELENDYIMWAFVTHRQQVAERAVDLGAMALQSLVEERVADWHPTLRRLIAETDASTVQAFDFSAAAPVEPWKTSNVTLLGDALHYMPPVGGMGGNAALHDAHLLCQAIASAVRGEVDLEEALSECEDEMRTHGFAAVRASLMYTRLAISRVRPLRTMARSFFRLCGWVPPLRRAIF